MQRFKNEVNLNFPLWILFFKKLHQNTERIVFFFLFFKFKAFSRLDLDAGGGLVAKLCPTLCDPMDCSPPGSSVHGISQARILEWVAIPFSGESSQPRDWTWVSCLAGRHFTVWATREAQVISPEYCHNYFEMIKKKESLLMTYLWCQSTGIFLDRMILSQLGG